MSYRTTRPSRETHVCACGRSISSFPSRRSTAIPRSSRRALGAHLRGTARPARERSPTYAPPRQASGALSAAHACSAPSRAVSTTRRTLWSRAPAALRPPARCAASEHPPGPPRAVPPPPRRRRSRSRRATSGSGRDDARERPVVSPKDKLNCSANPSTSVTSAQPDHAERSAEHQPGQAGCPLQRPPQHRRKRHARHDRATSKRTKGDTP